MTTEELKKSINQDCGIIAGDGSTSSACAESILKTAKSYTVEKLRGLISCSPFPIDELESEDGFIHLQELVHIRFIDQLIKEIEDENKEG